MLLPSYELRYRIVEMSGSQGRDRKWRGRVRSGGGAGVVVQERVECVAVEFEGVVEGSSEGTC